MASLLFKTKCQNGIISLTIWSIKPKCRCKQLFVVYFNQCLYRKDTEPFISCFHVLTYNTSFQYLSIHAMTFIACYNYLLSSCCSKKLKKRENAKIIEDKFCNKNVFLSLHPDAGRGFYYRKTTLQKPVKIYNSNCLLIFSQLSEQYLFVAGR